MSRSPASGWTRFPNQQFNSLYERNDPTKGGSHYIRAKIKNAYDSLLKSAEGNPVEAEGSQPSEQRTGEEAKPEEKKSGDGETR